MNNSKKKPPAKKPPVARYVVGAVVVLGLIAFLTTRSGGTGDGTSVRQVADVAVTGANLPGTPDQGAVDEAVGMAMPEIRGQDFGGTPVTITNDGRPKAILLLAHW